MLFCKLLLLGTNIATEEEVAIKLVSKQKIVFLEFGQSFFLKNVVFIHKGVHKIEVSVAVMGKQNL